MERYEWITLNLYDPNSQQDLWDMIEIFSDCSLSHYSDLLLRSYFPFIIRKQVEEKGHEYKRYAEAIGYMFLFFENQDSDVLYLNYGLKRCERGKGFMSLSMHILNHKLIGNTDEWADWKREYEKIMNGFLIVNKVPIKDEFLNTLAIKYGNLVMSDDCYNYYEMSFAFSLSDEIHDEYKKIIERDNMILKR